jgi:hypothetical protein
MAESIVVLKEKQRMSAERSIRRIPIDCIGKIDVEICYDWLTFDRHIGRRGKICALNILQVGDQSLLRRTSRA